MTLFLASSTREIMAPNDTLKTVNESVHMQIDGDLLSVLERLTELDWAGLKTTWSRFEQRLLAHMELEERDVFPVYAAFSEFERGGAPEIFEGDHASIMKVLNACREALEALEGVCRDERREMVLRLGPFVRLRNVLEHHTLREEQMLYPRLDASLPQDKRQVLVERLRGA
jgi:iron-sulfur cluster repair protein YtfE (RIC family)